MWRDWLNMWLSNDKGKKTLLICGVIVLITIVIILISMIFE